MTAGVVPSFGRADELNNNRIVGFAWMERGRNCRTKGLRKVQYGMHVEIMRNVIAATHLSELSI